MKLKTGYRDEKIRIKLLNFMQILITAIATGRHAYVNTPHIAVRGGFHHVLLINFLNFAKPNSINGCGACSS